MDTVNLEKLQAMKKYHKIQLTQIIFQYCLTFMAVILCLSKSVWIMSLCFAIKGFFRSTLPCVGAYVMTPRCLFVLCNVIIVILVGESKLVRSASPLSTSDVYDEYVGRIRSQSLKRKPIMQQKMLEYSTDTSRSQAEIIVDDQDKVMDEEPEEEGPQNDLEDEEPKEEDPQNDMEDEEEEEEKQAKEEQGEDIEGASEEEEQGILREVQKTSNAGEDDRNYLQLTEELNKRVEDFIAKVNRQRRIEADLLICNG